MFTENLTDLAIYFLERKLPCQIVYQFSVNKIVTTQGVIRDMLVKKGETWLILENGLPISLATVRSIQPFRTN